MSLPLYDCVLVLPTDVTDDERNSFIEIIKRFITPPGADGVGGAVAAEKVLYKRTLSYPIKKRTEGIYYQVEFTSPGPALAEIDGLLRIQERLLRFLITRRDLVKQRKKIKAVRKPRPTTTDRRPYRKERFNRKDGADESAEPAAVEPVVEPVVEP